MHNNNKKVLFIFGTRPEAIKMAPIIIKAQKTKELLPIVCVTGQHREMLNQVLDFFQITPDYNLELMSANQDLYSVTIKGLERIKSVIEETEPDIILVQGDTTTSFIGSLAGYYSKIKVGHVEAGLRSSNKFSPYPEEIFRTLNGHIADIHFAPTKTTIDNLAKENITKNVFLTGNTVIDSLFLGLDIIKSKGEDTYYDEFQFIDFTKKIILITCHRRENFGAPLDEICRAVKDIAESYKDKVHFVYPVHLNPNVQNTVQEKLGNISNISLIEPLKYNHIIWLMSKAYLIITDSGGIQEEAPSLAKPVLVIRDVTERVEAIEAGTAKLVGTKYKHIVSETQKLIEDKDYYNLMSKANNPYGDGRASEYIVDILKKKLKL